MLHSVSIDSVCAALAYAMGIEAPAQSAAPNEQLTAFVDRAFSGRKADRVCMYNPDAVAAWIREKYAWYLSETNARTQISIPLRTVMPSVTPVCFATMYTGAQPEVHGIRAYQKPVIRIDSLFDALIRAGKRAAILADNGSSMSKIYLERDMDYFFYDTLAEINAKAAELICADEYDFIAVYHKDYDEVMHKFGPESMEAISALRSDDAAFASFDALIQERWKRHDTLVGFAMDHGCHEIDGHCGSHGLDMEEDLNIVHSYAAHPRSV